MIIESLNDLVHRILVDAERNGKTTKRALVASAVCEIQRAGGIEKYGEGEALKTMLLAGHVETLFSQQMKSGMSDRNARYIRANAPPNFTDNLKRIPAWIALGEGQNAPWTPSLKASADEWVVNANLKAKKAQQTIKQADHSMEMADYLKRYGMNSLEDGLGDYVEDAA